MVSQADLREAQAQLAFAQEEMQRYQQLADTGAIALIQVKAKEEAFHAAEAKRDRALAQTNPSNAPVTAAQAIIQQQQSQGEVSAAKIAQERTKLLSQRIALQKSIDQDRITLQQLQQDQKKPILKAPISGQMHQLMLRNVGQYIPLGQTIAQISPQDTPLLFKARIPAEEISQIKPCLGEAIHCNPITLRIEAYPYPEYGVLSGKITAMTPDVIESAEPGKSTKPLFYEVTIEPDRPSLTKDNQSFPLKPGMAAIVEISTQQETFLSFLLKKARLIGDRN
ncbi:MAG: HlyD family efflux transporter periplasmic adaptor subunit [Alkalinema sp. RU_4_3]|nr:HlyD family efflux transporter periplasmic adaptor subunit [Alkalinema sp. RU_4_3]